MRCPNWARVCASAVSLFGLALLAPAYATTLVVINNNAPGIGLNDPSPAVPVGGNSGLTVGAQRLIAFQFAADIWAARLQSNVPIRVGAQFTALTCSTTSAILGSAGPANAFRDFSGAPVAGTYYPVALANSLRGSDLDAAGDDISANFNSNLGTVGCLDSSGWYYGLDSNPPAGRIDFVSVLLHEMGHGLGFLTFVNLATGAKVLGFNDAFMLNLERHGAAPADYPSMSDAQRVAASIDTGNLHWVGANVRAASAVLTAGRVGDHVRMFAPNPAQPGSSVSHWDTVLTPDQMMEPSYTVPLHSPVLELPAFKDIGWKLLSVTITGAKKDDFNGDSKSDIFWQHALTGQTVEWSMSGLSLATFGLPFAVPDLNWKIIGSGDFDGDGKADLLWQNAATGQVVEWLMNGSTVLSQNSPATIPDLNWKILGIGDFNGDGKADILWQNASTGQIVFWLMNGATITLQNSPGAVSDPNWKVRGIADFNGDGKADVLWHNAASGQVVEWLMNGATIGSQNSPATIADLSWQIAGTGDYNGDGRADILWRNTASGNVVSWFMNGGTIDSYDTILTVSDTNWVVVGTGDYDGDGKADILWRHLGSGTVYIWLMNGRTIVSQGSPATVPDLNWRIIATK